MQVYTTRKFLTLLTVSIIIAVTVAYGVVAIVPSFIPLHSPSFSLSTGSSPLQVTPGSSRTYMVHLNSQNGFSGSLKLAARIPNAPNSLAVTVSPQEVSLSPGGSAPVTLSVSTNPITPAGVYSIFLDETSQILSRTDTVNLSVVGFIATADPTSLTFATTSTGKSEITVTSVINFTGQVNLSASSSASGTFVNVGPNTLFLSKNGTATSTLAVQSSAQGQFDVTVTIIGNQFYQSVTLPVTATSSNPGDFSITTIPASFSLNPGHFRNVVVKLDGVGCGCLVTLSPSIPPADFSYGISPYIVSVPAGGSVNSTLTLSLDPNTPTGIYTIAVTGTSLSIIHTTQLTATVSNQALPDFTFPGPNPRFLRVTQGAQNVSTIFVTPVNGFTGPISLTSTIYPLGSPGVSISFNPTTVQLPGTADAYSSATSTLTLSATASASIGGYNFSITGTSGTLSNSMYGNFFVTPPPHALLATSLATAATAPASVFDSVLNLLVKEVSTASNSAPITISLDLISSTVLTLLAIPTASTAACRTSITFRRRTHHGS